MYTWWINCVCILVMLGHGKCDYVSDIRRLYAEVVDVNNPWIRPASDGGSLNITVLFFTLSAISMSDTTQTMSTSGYLGITWQDSFLTWLASNYSGIGSVSPDPDKIWRPTLAVRNSIQKATPFKADFMYTTVTANGDVLWYPGDVFETICEMDVTNYPFDIHVCSIDLTLWTSVRNEVTLKLSDTMKFKADEYVENNEWELQKSKSEIVKIGNVYPFVRLTFTLKRRPSTFVVNVVGPIYVIALLNVFIFLIPSQSGEKIQFGVLILLAYAVFMTYTSGRLPQSWDTSSVLGNYFLVLQVFCVIYILLGILSAAIYSRDDYRHRISPRLARMVEVQEMIFLCRCCCKKSATSASTVHVSPAEEPCSHNGKTLEFGTANPVPLRRVPEPVDMNWKRVSRALDMMFFWIFLLVIIFSMIGVMVYIQP